MKLLIALLVTAWTLQGQTPRIVTLTWDDNLNPPGTTYSLYRAAGPCTPSSVFALITAAVAVKTYDDVGIAPGQYCYVATAVFGGEESDYSNQAAAKVKPRPPGQFGVTVR